jgi:hypothetical protein
MKDWAEVMSLMVPFFFYEGYFYHLDFGTRMHHVYMYRYWIVSRSEIIHYASRKVEVCKRIIKGQRNQLHAKRVSLLKMKRLPTPDSLVYGHVTVRPDLNQPHAVRGRRPAHGEPGILAGRFGFAVTMDCAPAAHGFPAARHVVGVEMADVRVKGLEIDWLGNGFFPFPVYSLHQITIAE